MDAQQQHTISPVTSTTTSTTSSNSRSDSVPNETTYVATTTKHTSTGEFQVPLRKQLLLAISLLLILGGVGITLAGTIIFGAVAPKYDNYRRYLGCWITLTVIQFLLMGINIFYMILFAFKKRSSAAVLKESSQQLQLKSQKISPLDLSLKELLLLHYMRWISDSILLLLGAYHVACVALSSWTLGYYYYAESDTSILTLLGSLICLIAIVIMLYATKSVYKRPRTRIFISAVKATNNNYSEATDVVQQTGNVVASDHVQYPQIMHTQPSNLPSDDSATVYSYNMVGTSDPMQSVRSGAPPTEM